MKFLRCFASLCGDGLSQVRLDLTSCVRTAPTATIAPRSGWALRLELWLEGPCSLTLADSTRAVRQRLNACPFLLHALASCSLLVRGACHKPASVDDAGLAWLLNLDEIRSLVRPSLLRANKIQTLHKCALVVAFLRCSRPETHRTQSADNYSSADS